MKTGSYYWWELWRQAATTGGNYEDRQPLLVGTMKTGSYYWWKRQICPWCVQGLGRGGVITYSPHALHSLTLLPSSHTLIIYQRVGVPKKIYNIDDNSKTLCILNITIPHKFTIFCASVPDKYLFIMSIIQYSVYQILSLSYEGGGGGHTGRRGQTEWK